MRTRVDSWASLPLLAGAAITLGHALEVHHALSHIPAMLWLSAALLLTLTGVLSLRIPWLQQHGRVSFMAVAVAGVAFQLWHLLRNTAELSPLYSVTLVLLVCLLLTAAIVTRPTCLLKVVVVPALVIAHFLGGLLVIRHSPKPRIDVYYFHQQAFAAIKSGRDPHSGTIQDLYPEKDYYGEGVVQNGRVQVGFPYPPLSLILALPAQFLFGDYRYALLAAMAVTAFLLAYARPGLQGPLAALIFLSTPRTLYLIELGWTDTFVAMMLAATVFFACRRTSFLPTTLGLLLASKQYSVIALPFAHFLLPQSVERKKVTRLLLSGIGVATAVTLPMLIWNPSGFVSDILLFQIRQPFRPDSLSFLGWVASTSGLQPPVWIGFLMLLPGVWLAFKRLPRTPAGFSAAVALTSFLFFAFNKQAFANYYLVVIGALCCAIAASAPLAKET